MDLVTFTPRGNEVLHNEVQNYYRNFGSMNKNDFEVLFIHILMENGCNGMSNFELSRMLRVPETKIKRLRYEADLKYSQISDSGYMEEKMRQLNSLLTNVVLKNEGKLIEFAMEDIALRRFLDNILKKAGRFSDSSFNSEVVKINIDDFIVLLSYSVENEKQRKELIAEAEKVLNGKVDYKDLITNLVKIAANITSIGADVSLGGLISLLPRAVKHFPKITGCK